MIRQPQTGSKREETLAGDGNVSLELFFLGCKDPHLSDDFLDGALLWRGLLLLRRYVR